MASLKKIAVSAPGKVLIAGGYLILDPEQIGLVIALSARIYCVIEHDEETVSEEDDAIITVTSPQFLNAQWKYKVINSSNGLRVENLSPSSSNDYVRITVSYVLAYHNLPSIPSIKITILADNDYYSQTSSPTHADLSSLPRFNKLHLPITEANKTGLGSSAALITSLTASMLVFLSDIDLNKDKRIIHNLAQAAHCAAQGKVGSGFDVASAVYGSCIYQRFTPEILEGVLLDNNSYENGFRDQLRGVVGRKWKMDVKPFELSSALRVVMGDVSAGSATPSMVKSVLKWKAGGEGAKDVWEKLGWANRRLIEYFNQLNAFETEDIINELKRGLRRSRESSRPQIHQSLEDISIQFEEIRSMLRLMGSQSSVPIEPDSQTSLLDACLQVDGVLIAGVPGAGGFDAIFCIIANDGDGVGSTFRRLLDVWERREVKVCPLLAKGERAGILLEDLDQLD